MNGATALDCENTISRPNSTNTSTIGTSQYFFSCRRNCQNSANTRLLLMKVASLSIHSLVVFGVTITCRVWRPTRPLVPPARQRILPDQPPHHRQRHEHDRKKNRQQHPRVDVPERPRKPPPCGAGIREDRRVQNARREQK